MLADKDLLLACQCHDPKSQVVFYDRYKARLMGISRRYAKNIPEAEDILQEAFIRIFQNLHQIKNPEAILAWAKKTVTHTAINYYRANLKFNYLSEDEGLEQPNGEYAELMSQLSTEEILKFIQELPDGYRLIFNLCIVDGYDHAEIAQMLGISAGTSRSQLFKARELLRKKLRAAGIENYEKHT